MYMPRLRQDPPVIAGGYGCTPRGLYCEIQTNRSGNTGKYNSSSLETGKTGFLYHRKLFPINKKGGIQNG